MNHTLKWTFIPFLLLVSISASLFMILESGSFFQKLYHRESSFLNMGYWAAGLNEVFMAVMAAVWLPDIIERNRKNKTHPGNYLFKFLLVFLFLTTVLGSSFNTIFPILGKIQLHQNNDKIIGLLQSQVQDNNKSLNTFVKQKQRMNSALSVKRQIQTKEELKNLLKDRKPVFSLWIEAVVIIVIRFGVQLANLSCIWLTGWIYRQPPKQPNQQLTVSALKKKNSVPAKTDLSFHQQIIGKKNNTETNSKPVLPEISKPCTPSIAHKSVQKDIGQQEPGLNRFRPSDLKQTNRVTIPKSNEKKYPEQTEKDVDQLRRKISSLLRSRNEGISLFDIGKAIGEKESRLRDIANPKARILTDKTLKLENILFKIEKLYQREYTNTI